MTKRKGGIVAIVLAVLAIVISQFCLGFSHTTVQASAATTSLYNIRFNYTATKGTFISTATTEQASGTNVLETDEIQCGKIVSSKRKVQFQIYGSSYSGTGNLSNGGYIGSDTINITNTGTFSEHTYEVKNSSGVVIKTVTTKSFSLSGLSDGLYSVS